MLKTNQIFFLLIFCISLALTGQIYAANTSIPPEQNKIIIPDELENIWDPEKYISLEEVKPGMEAYCLTEYSISGIEKFGLEIIDTVKDLDIGRDVILVKGTDEEFIRTGPVAGCSGSPVYIEGRLAGALAYTWSYSTEPLYAATPIEDMFRIDQGTRNFSSGPKTLVYDFSKPINFEQVHNKYKNLLSRQTRSVAGLNPLPCPLITSGLSVEVSEQLKAIAEPMGFMIVAGGSGSIENAGDYEDIKLAPGGCLGVPLVNGDIKLSTMGTVTEVIGDKVYGFGHLLLGYGQIDLPMSTGRVHTIVSNISTSFKLASVLKTVGALRIDEATGVIGQIGAIPKTIPLIIHIDHYNDSKQRTYNCELVYNELVTPSYLQMAVNGAALQSGDLPPEHMIEYEFNIGLEDTEVISFKNVSTDMAFSEMSNEYISAVNLLMNNPFKKADIQSIDCNIRIIPENISSTIWSVDLSDSTVKAGDSIDIVVILESYLGGKKRYQLQMDVSENLKPGKYELIICGSRAYEQFLSKTVPHRFLAQSMPTLIEALNNALSIDRGRLYCMLVMPPDGIILEKSELPNLPATKTMILQDTKRTINITPYRSWIEKSIQTNTITTNRETFSITVEQ